MEVAVLGCPVPNSPYGLCGRKATLNLKIRDRAQELCECQGDRPGLTVPNNPYGVYGHKATWNSNLCHTELRSCVKVEVAVLGSLSPTVLMVSLGA